MANSTYLQATNTALKLAGLDPIPDNNTFDNLPLSKYQQTTKMAIMLGQQHLSLHVRRHFAERLIPLIISSGTTVYTLDTGISAENIILRSFFNLTVGEPLAGQNREIRNWPWEEFNRAYPDQSTITNGPPERWILLPIARTNVSPVHQVQIYPVPDNTYTLGFKAKLNAQQLMLSTDIILWPPEYEHALWEFAWNLLERDLGEGKEGQIAQLAQDAVNQVQLASVKPPDIRNAPQTMRMPRRRWGSSTFYYNSPASIGAGGQVID